MGCIQNAGEIAPCTLLPPTEFMQVEKGRSWLVVVRPIEKMF